LAFTLADLRLGAQRASDKVNDPHPDTAAWNAWINQAIEALYRRVTAVDPEAFYSTADFTLTGGTSGSSYALPATLRTLLGVTKDPTSTSRTTIPKFTFRDRNDFRPFPFLDYPACTSRRYRILGASLAIEPFEQAAGSYRIHYRQGPTVLTSDVSVLDPVLEPFAEYVELFAARKALGTEETDTSELAARMRELEQEIILNAARDVATDGISDTAGW
jgi:hypothetical protein